MQRVGLHVSISKGLESALEKAQAIGANTIQIFSSPPQSFTPPKFNDEDCKVFKNKAKELDIAPVLIHACYLINLASETERLRLLSIQSLIEDLTFADKIGAKGTIVHTGSHKGKGFSSVLPTVVESIKKILSKTPDSTKLYLEIASGGNGKIGSTFEELHEMLSAVNDERLGVCLDTCHMFAGGYKFDTQESVSKLIKKITETIGWKMIECMHVNDSRGEFGSTRDRHENLGQGFIGKDGLRLILKPVCFNKLPLILETPGFDEKGPDKQNLDILRNLIS